MFIVVFILALLASLAYQSMPPGLQIYDALNVPSTDYKVLGISATTLVIAIFNGVIYGIIICLIYSLAVRATKRKPKQQQQAQ